MKILIVEDESIVALDLFYRLESKGFVVTGIASSGDEAVRLCRRECPDVVIMDIKLKGKMNGIEAAERIHSFQPIPILYLTAYSDQTTISKARRLPYTGFLFKPFEFEDLHAEICAMTRQFTDRDGLTIPGSKQTGSRRRQVRSSFNPGLSFSS
jgi:DNA-binding NarL/FixJ family response regulator